MIDPAQIAARPQVPADHSRATPTEGFEPGDTIPLSAATPGTGRHRQFFDMFDETTRNAIRAEPGRLRQRPRRPRAAAQRSDRRPAAASSESGQPVLRTIVEPSTDFAGFWRALEDLSATVAPVAETQASLFVALDRTFAAFARVSRPYIQETIVKEPADRWTSVNDDLPAMRPFLRNSARFFTALQAGREGARPKPRRRSPPPSAPASRRSTPRRSSTPSCRRPRKRWSPSRNAPGVFNGLDLLIDTNNVLKPAIRFIAPAQTTCNYLTLAFRKLANASSEGNDARQLAQRDLASSAPEGPNSEAGPASAPANGPGLSRTTSTSTPTRTPPSPGQPTSAKRATSDTSRARP